MEVAELSIDMVSSSLVIENNVVFPPKEIQW